MEIDKFQGITEDGKKFGYISGNNGGWFFTWYDTKEETLASLEIDYVDGDGGISYNEALNALSKVFQG